jgi:hypothetical protein
MRLWRRSGEVEHGIMTVLTGGFGGWKKSQQMIYTVGEAGPWAILYHNSDVDITWGVLSFKAMIFRKLSSN